MIFNGWVMYLSPILPYRCIGYKVLRRIITCESNYGIFWPFIFVLSPILVYFTGNLMLTLVLQSAGFEKANKVYRIIRLPTPTVHKMKTARNLDHLLRFTQWSLFPCSEAHLHPLLLISKGIFILYFILPLMRRKQLEYLFRVVFYILDGFPERTFFQKDERRVEGIDEQRASERGMQDMKKGLQQQEMMNMLCNISIQDRPHGPAVPIRGSPSWRGHSARGG